jgi:hypothetical protein
MRLRRLHRPSLQGGRFRLSPVAHPGRRAELGPLVLADSVALRSDGAVQGRLPVQMPLLIAPDDVLAHPYKVAMEVPASLRTPR